MRVLLGGASIRNYNMYLWVGKGEPFSEIPKSRITPTMRLKDRAEPDHYKTSFVLPALYDPKPYLDPKVSKIMTFMASFLGLGLFFYILLGSR